MTSDIEAVEQPVEMIALFSEGQAKPIRFRLGGAVYKVSRIHSTWQTDTEKGRVTHYAVSCGGKTTYELTFLGMDWRLERVKGGAAT